MKIAWREAQHQINDNGKDDHVEGANGRIAGVNCDRSQGVGGKGNDGNNDDRLSNRLHFYFEDKFYARRQWQKGEL